MAEHPTPTNAETEIHFVEIPMDSGNNEEVEEDGDNHNNHSSNSTYQQCLIAHPIAELSESPGHLLLLSLYRRAEGRLACRVGLGEARLDNARREAFRHSSLFLAFHSLFLTLLLAAASGEAESSACRKWWLPSCLSALTSCALIVSVQVRVCEYWRARGQLGRDRCEERAVKACIQELRLKGTSYDLSRELQTRGAAAAAKRRGKCSSVGIKWRPRQWLSRNLVTTCMLVLAGLLVLACRPMLCS